MPIMISLQTSSWRSRAQRLALAAAVALVAALAAAGARAATHIVGPSAPSMTLVWLPSFFGDGLHDLFAAAAEFGEVDGNPSDRAEGEALHPATAAE